MKSVTLKRMLSAVTQCLICASLLFGGLLVTASSAQDAAVEPPLAIVGSSRITADDVNALLQGRTAFATLPEEERFDKMLENLVAEYMVDYLFGQDLSLLSPEVLVSLSDARRQVLLQLYVQSQFVAPEIPEEDVNAYAAENPHLFADRKAYQMLRFDVAGGSDADRRAAIARVEAIHADQGPSFTALNDILPDLNADGVQATLTPLWATSEALPDELREVVQAMASDGRDLEVAFEDNAASAMMLVSWEALPTNPDDVKAQIQQRLLAQSFAEHREDMITLIAQPILSGTDASSDPRAIEPPAQGTVVWSASNVIPREVRLGALFCLVVSLMVASYGLVSWVKLVFAQVGGYRRTLPRVPFLNSTVFAVLFGLVFTIFAAAFVYFGWQVSAGTYGRRMTVLLIAGAAVTAAGLIFVWNRKIKAARAEIREEMQDEYLDEKVAEEVAISAEGSHKRLLATIGLLILSGGFFAVLLGFSFGLG